MKREYKLSKSDLRTAQFYAWSNNLCVLIYPIDMNLIVVDKEREEHCYLKDTRVYDSSYYEKQGDFFKAIREEFNEVMESGKHHHPTPECKDCSGDGCTSGFTPNCIENCTVYKEWQGMEKEIKESGLFD